MFARLFAAAALAAAVPAFADGPKVGDTAPDFTAKDQDGKEVKLSDLKGKNVILWFYPKAMTSGCTKEGCLFRDDKPKFDKLDAVILGVSMDQVDAQKKFVEKEKFNFTLLADPEGNIVKAYGVPMLKPGICNRSTVVIDKDGKILYLTHKVDIPKQNAKLLELLGEKK